MQINSVTIPAAAIVLAMAALPAFAQGGRAVWTFDHFTPNQGGQTTYMLSYGVPETDAAVFTATCHSGMQGPAIPVMLSLDHGAAPAGTPLTVRIGSNNFNADYAAVVFSQGSESAGVRVQLGVNDPLWHALTHGQDIAFSVLHRQPVGASLQGAAQPVENFLQTCRSVFAQTDAATPAPSHLKIYRYVCDDGTRFGAQFDNSRSYSIAVLSFIDGPDLPLIQAESGSGVRYANGDVTLYTEGDTAVLARIGKPNVNCRATNP